VLEDPFEERAQDRMATEEPIESGVKDVIFFDVAHRFAQVLEADLIGAGIGGQGGAVPGDQAQCSSCR